MKTEARHDSGAFDRGYQAGVAGRSQDICPTPRRNIARTG